MGSDVTDVGEPQPEKQPFKRPLKKHVATIHRTNGLSLLQGKISNALLYHAYHELKTCEEHEISVQRLCQIIGYCGNNHQAIKDALKGLIATVLEWNVLDEESGLEDWTASSILASVNIKGPICCYAYSPRMKRLLYSPTVYGKINMAIQAQFRSSYGLALYENCARYKGLPQTKWFDLSVFRKLMGVQEKKYVIFRDLKRRVIDKAVHEVNTYSDMIIVPEYLKVGRKVVKLCFKLKERVRKERLGRVKQLAIDDTEEAALLAILLQKFQVSRKGAITVCAQYEPAYIREKIKLIENQKVYQQGRVENIAAYLLTALKENYQSEEQLKEAKQQEKRSDDLSKIIEREKDRQQWQYKKQADKKKREAFLQDLEKLTKLEQGKIFENFIIECKKNNPYLANIAEKHGYEHVIVLNEYQRYFQRSK